MPQRPDPTMNEVLRKLTNAPQENEDFCSLHQQWGGGAEPSLSTQCPPWTMPGERVPEKERVLWLCQPHSLADFLHELQMSPSCSACLVSASPNTRHCYAFIHPKAKPVVCLSFGRKTSPHLPGHSFFHRLQGAGLWCKGHCRKSRPA